jgi:carbon monoxide dehydrogenase subunit G
VEISKSQTEIYEFLSDFNNFEKLMPENVSNWESTSDECSFSVKGMASIGMAISDRMPDDQILISSTPKSPFRFNLNCFVENVDKTQSITQLVFEADLNPVIQMMAEKPLTNLFELIIEKLKEVHST